MQTLADRFWMRVQVADPDACWSWRGARDYGRIRVEDRTIAAHRLSYELHFGPIPEGLLVLHRCDNPPCVNPAHLFVGTAGDNARDKVAKNRRVGGRRKLTAQLVASARDRYRAGGITLQALADDLGVGKESMSRALFGHTWTHVPGALSRTESRWTTGEIVGRSERGRLHCKHCRNFAGPSLICSSCEHEFGGPAPNEDRP